MGEQGVVVAKLHIFEDARLDVRAREMKASSSHQSLHLMS